MPRSSKSKFAPYLINKLLFLLFHFLFIQTPFYYTKTNKNLTKGKEVIIERTWKSIIKKHPWVYLKLSFLSCLVFYRFFLRECFILGRKKNCMKIEKFLLFFLCCMKTMAARIQASIFHIFSMRKFFENQSIIEP